MSIGSLHSRLAPHTFFRNEVQQSEVMLTAGQTICALAGEAHADDIGIGTQQR